MSHKRSQPYPANPLIGKLPTLLVVGVFLLCHGLLTCHVVSGAMMLLHTDPPLSSSTHEEKAIVFPAVVQGAIQEEQLINDVMQGSYFTVLILVALLGLVLKDTRSSWRLLVSATVAPAFGSRALPFLFHRTRGTPASFLQVFRL